METIPLNTDSSPNAVLDLLFKLKVKDVMSAPVLTAGAGDSLRSIQLRMKRKNITGMPIVAGNRLVGIVSMDDIVNAFDGGWIDDRAEAHMTRDIIVLQETMSVSFCVSYFNKYGFGRFPVLNAEHELTGIVTASDVISALLVSMNSEMERLENEAASLAPDAEARTGSAAAGTAGNADDKNAVRVVEFKTEPFNFETAGMASTEIKKLLKTMGTDPSLARRIGIASYELEINQVVHSCGGVMRYFIAPEKLVIEAQDTGPGIPDVAKALTEGFSTADDRIRALGFGAGMGLPNTKRVSDDFDITSAPGSGTTVHAVFYFKNP
ncbi:CBS domain-containing protein [Treponema brennaborense]|uniref:Signal transduction protein with CBS domains n=1 Tax=Treponema brennaborense (strain DSM 12168 / CIP 105900 / DD5/3) TaxID=906968 RepID=F4LMX9_TREBD|nr:CBS domain-containing protein [Treponema brennaborense]AEE15765.1 putative signal transduction protein with CBS domains [Treponema brennaborense DSM 12168]